MFVWDVKRGDETAWIGWNPVKGQKGTERHEKGTIITVKKMLAKNTPLRTRMNFVAHGGIADDNIIGKEIARNEVYLSIKNKNIKLNDVTKYGGYKNVSSAYYFVVQHENDKGNMIRTIETLPIYMLNVVEDNEKTLQTYCIQKLKLKNPTVVYKKIKVQSLLKINGFYVYITGKSNDVYTLRNAVTMCLNQNWINYIKKIDYANEKGRIDKSISYEKNIELYDIIISKYKNTIFMYRTSKIVNKIERAKQKFIELTLLEQCKIIKNLFVLSSIGENTTDLSLIGEGKKVGQITVNKKISNYNEFKIIHQSVTGLYETVIDLLKV